MAAPNTDLPSKPRRHAFSDIERRALRRRHKTHPTEAQQALKVWFEERFNHPIDRSQISRILSATYAHLDRQVTSKAYRKSQGEHPRLEDALHSWHSYMEQKGATITGYILREKASLLWDLMPQVDGRVKPSFSNGWLEGFKKRKNIRECIQDGENASVSLKEGEERMQEIRKITAQYALDDCYNMDETGLSWKALPNRSLATPASGGKKQGRARITAIFCCNASGNDKYEVWIIGTAAKPRCFYNAKIQSLPCKWRWNKAAWINEPLMLEWLLAFNEHVKPRKVLLLMDNFSAHISAFRFLQIEAGLNQPLSHVHIEWLPPNSKSHYQPLDHGIINSFKGQWRRIWLSYCLEQLGANKDPRKTTHVLNAVRWTARAWDSVTSQTIATCWTHSTCLANHPCYPSTETQESSEYEAEVIRRDTEVQVSKAIQQLVSEVSNRMAVSSFLDPTEEVVEDSSHDALELAAEIYSNEEIAAASDEEEDAGTEREVTIREARDGIKAVKLFYEQAGDTTDATFTGIRLLLHDIERRQQHRRQQQPQQSVLTTQKSILSTQQSILTFFGTQTVDPQVLVSH